MNNKDCFIYLVKLDGVPKYVGFTSTTISKRWEKYCNDARSGSNSVLHASIRKYGKEAFAIECVYTSNNLNETLNVMEQKYINEYKTHVRDGGYNMTNGGEGSVGVFVSEETRTKRSNSLKGRVFSEETRRKISEAKTGVPRTKEAKEKISIGHKNSDKAMNHIKNLSAAWTGKKHTDESKRKMSLIHTGRKLSEEIKKKISDSHKQLYFN